MKRLFALAAVCAVLSLPATLLGAVITVDVVGADWNNVTGTPSNLNYVNTDSVAGNEEIRWGTGAQQSGYRFDGSAPPSFNVTEFELFSLGDFTHFNFPISAGTSISGANLDITLDLTIGGAQSLGPLTFKFNHNETTNTGDPEASRDIVLLENLVSSDSFMIGGDEYTLVLSGFSTDGGVTIVDTFKTYENQANSAELYGQFVLVQEAEVPEPTSCLILAGLALTFGVGSWRRRRGQATEV